MIIGKINPGSGIGDQLFGYIATRVRAEDLGVAFGFVGKEFFKGQGWMDVDFGEEVNLNYHIEQPSGKLIIDDLHKLFEITTSSFNPEFEFVEDGTVIDGYGAQDTKYFEHRLLAIREWLKVEPLEMLEDACIINFRGGEYKLFPELFLTQEYWDKAVTLMKERDSNIKFEVHTDDIEMARSFFHYPIIHDVSLNWRVIRYAKHLIIPNSAFPILPALLNENVAEVIAPRYWAGRNVGAWQRPQNYYKKFTYI